MFVVVFVISVWSRVSVVFSFCRLSSVSFVSVSLVAVAGSGMVTVFSVVVLGG